MDNAPDSGPAKKPTPRATSNSQGTRKPPPVRKPATRKPATKSPAEQPKAAAARKPAAAPAKVVEEHEFEDATVLSPRDAELREQAAALVEEPVEVVVEPEPEVIAEPESEPEVVVESEPEPETVEPETVEPGTLTASSPGFAASVAAWARRVAGASGARRNPEPELDEAETAVELFPAGEIVAQESGTVLSVRGLTKRFDDKVAVAGVNLEVSVGAFYGIVGPNGAGKTTTLSMITGLLRPDSGSVVVNGSDVWKDTVQAKRMMGVLPDRLRLFDRLTGAQLLYYAGVLRGLDHAVVRSRTADLAHAFGLEESLGRLVSDYSAGMTKKIALAAAMIHSPRLLVLDEPFESVDPVSAATVTEILKKYVAAGGTVVLSSHSMDLVQRICDHVAVVVNGEILADGTMAEVRNGQTLEERFVDLAGGRTTVEGLEWLHSFSA